MHDICIKYVMHVIIMQDAVQLTGIALGSKGHLKSDGIGNNMSDDALVIGLVPNPFWVYLSQMTDELAQVYADRMYNALTFLVSMTSFTNEVAEEYEQGPSQREHKTRRYRDMCFPKYRT